jgi:hypothetical protein
MGSRTLNQNDCPTVITIISPEWMIQAEKFLGKGI